MAATPTLSGTFSGSQSAGSLGSVKITFEVLRAKKLPQSEDEALACTSSIRVSVMKTNLGPGAPAGVAPMISAVQKANNNPYFNETMEIVLAPTIEQVWLWIEVVEHARQSTPQTILHGQCVVACGNSSTGKGAEQTLCLVDASPVNAPEKFAAAESAAAASKAADAPSLSVRFKVAVTKPQKKEVDHNADVVYELPVELTGFHKLIPADAAYSWIHLLFDEKWNELFSECAVDQWRSAASLAVASPRRPSNAAGETLPRKGSTAAPQKSPRAGGDGGGGGKGGGAIKTLGDLVINQWGCKRTHQVVARLRMAAERFCRGQASVVFTLDDEAAQKKIWNERAAVRLTLVKRSYENFSGNDRLRAMLDRLWMLMAMGISAEGPLPQITIDQRMKLQNAPFTSNHAETLQACLLHRLCSSLPWPHCEAIAKEDLETKLPPPPPPPPRQANVTVPPSQDPKMHPQLCFVDVLVSFVAKIADSLTDNEFAQLLEAFVPAVKDAHARCAASGAGSSTSGGLAAGGIGANAGGSAPKSGKKSGRQGSADKK